MHRGLSILLPFLLLLSCREPSSEEMFVRRQDAPGGVYAFDLPLTDSLRLYQLEFYGRLDGKEEVLMEQSAVEADILLRSPSDSLYGEKIWLVAREESYYSSSFKTVWRKDIAPSEYGIWKLYVSIPARYDALDGIGVILSHKDR